MKKLLHTLSLILATFVLFGSAPKANASITYNVHLSTFLWHTMNSPQKELLYMEVHHDAYGNTTGFTMHTVMTNVLTDNVYIPGQQTQYLTAFNYMLYDETPTEWGYSTYELVDEAWVLDDGTEIWAN